MIRFVAFSATGRAGIASSENVRAENLKPSALPYSHSWRRSGRSAALPYPPHERCDSNMAARWAQIRCDF